MAVYTSGAEETALDAAVRFATADATVGDSGRHGLSDTEPYLVRGPHLVLRVGSDHPLSGRGTQDCGAVDWPDRAAYQALAVAAAAARTPAVVIAVFMPAPHGD